MVRHGLVLSSIGSARFRAVLQDLHPTLLVDARYLSAGDLNTLAASCNPQAFQPWGNSLTEPRFAKKRFTWTRGLSEKSSGFFALSINVSPAPRGMPMLGEADAEKITANLQPKLVALRLRSLPKVMASDFDIPGLSSENRAIARLMGSAVIEAPELQAGLRLLLEGREEKLRDARWTDLHCVTLEALLAHCHKPGTQRVYVGEIAEDALDNPKGAWRAQEAYATGDGGGLEQTGIPARRRCKGQIPLTRQKNRGAYPSRRARSSCRGPRG